MIKCTEPLIVGDGILFGKTLAWNGPKMCSKILWKSSDIFRSVHCGNSQFKKLVLQVYIPHNEFIRTFWERKQRIQSCNYSCKMI